MLVGSGAIKTELVIVFWAAVFVVAIVVDRSGAEFIGNF